MTKIKMLSSRESRLYEGAYLGDSGSEFYKETIFRMRKRLPGPFSEDGYLSDPLRGGIYSILVRICDCQEILKDRGYLSSTIDALLD